MAFVRQAGLLTNGYERDSSNLPRRHRRSGTSARAPRRIQQRPCAGFSPASLFVRPRERQNLSVPESYPISDDQARGHSESSEDSASNHREIRDRSLLEAELSTMGIRGCRIFRPIDLREVVPRSGEMATQLGIFSFR